MSEKGFIDFQNFEKALQEKGGELSSSELSAILELINLRFDEVISKSEQQAESFARTITELNKTIASLNDVIETLKGKNNRNASNSNKPSSWDHFSKPNPKPSSINAGNGGSKKSSGGQKGHSGTTMKVQDTPDRVENLYPHKCFGCVRFAECLARASEKTARTVVDVEVRTIQTEYRQMSLCCPIDGTEQCGRFPAFAKSTFQYGPTVNAIVTELSSDGSVGMHKISTFMDDAFGIRMTDGTVSNIIGKCSDLSEGLVERFKDTFAEVHIANFDETGCRIQKKNGWLHIATSRRFSVFGFHKNRGDKGIKALGVYDRMKDPSQVAVTDFWGSYLKIDAQFPKKHAFCGAHLDREIQNLIDNYGNPACARKMKKLMKSAYVEVQELKGKGMTEAPQSLLDEVSEKYDKIVTAALNRHKPPKKTNKRGRPGKGTIRALFERFRDYKEGVLMFLHDFEVPFSNNQAERAARGMKTKLKVSGCFRSEEGAKAFCNIKSLMDTCRKHGLNHFEVLQDLFSGKDISGQFCLQ